MDSIITFIIERRYLHTITKSRDCTLSCGSNELPPLATPFGYMTGICAPHISNSYWVRSKRITTTKSALAALSNKS